MAATKITEIRILPPLAVGRLGSSPSPMDNYDFEGFVPAEDDPTNEATGYRKLVPAPTLVVDRQTGTITAALTPPGEPRFRDENHLIRPICPFLEVWALFDDSENLQPLTLTRLNELGLTAADVVWSVEAQNSKAARRTGDEGDKVVAATGEFSDHAVKDFVGQCQHFLPGKTLHLGDVQYIRPTPAFPEIRLRFTPAPGKVYGPDESQIPVGKRSPAKAEPVYDSTKGHWPGYFNATVRGKPDSRYPYPTQPSSIYWGKDDDKGNHVSYGFLDDMCDGVVHVSLKTKETTLTTFSRISVGPPDFAPDSLPIRTVSDELKQIDQGPDANGRVTRAQAEDIIRRALETVRTLYVPAMNGVPILVTIGTETDNHNTNNMAVQNFRDTDGKTTQRKINGQVDPAAPIEPVPNTGRAWSPIFEPPTGIGITNGEVTAAHRRLLKLIQGDQPLFGLVNTLLREYDRVGDYTDAGRAKMPGLMRNADGMLMALTRLMQSLLKQATIGYNEPDPPEQPGQIHPKNRTAQFEHRSQGNPPGTMLTTAVSNNFPGLEFDYRSIWHHVFVGITLFEAGPRVTAVDKAGAAYKAGVRENMLMILADNVPLWADVRGPKVEASSVNSIFQTQPLEYSNAIATIVQKAGQNGGAIVECVFVQEPVKTDPEDPMGPALAYTRDELFSQPRLTVPLEVRPMFAPDLGAGNAVFGAEIAAPGDLTQGLCSPWQNDYRECSCYYWAAARPDFVNRHAEDPSGREIMGDNWLQLQQDGHYEVDDRTSADQLKKFVSYIDLLEQWEQKLQFVIRGQTETKDR